MTIDVEALVAAQHRTEEHLDDLGEHVRGLAVAQRATEQSLTSLAVAQRATEQSLTSLVDVVSGMNDRLGTLDGQALERRYRARGQAYLSRIARRLRLLDPTSLNAMVDDAERAGTLSAAEAASIYLADAIFSGRRRDDDADVHLVVEASVTITRNDVRRARERADLFARTVNTPVIAVVAGEFAPEPVARAAQDADVWCVTNGSAVAPSDDLADGPG